MPEVLSLKKRSVIKKVNPVALALLLLPVVPLSAIIIAEHRGDVNPADAGWITRDSGNGVEEGPVRIGWESAWMIDDNSRTTGHQRWYEVTFNFSDNKLLKVHQKCHVQLWF